MPISRYFGGHGEEVMKAMKQEYGPAQGESVFYATANKEGEKPASDHHCSGVDSILAWGGGRRDFHPGGEGDTTEPSEAIHRASSIE